MTRAGEVMMGRQSGRRTLEVVYSLYMRCFGCGARRASVMEQGRGWRGGNDGRPNRDLTECKPPSSVYFSEVGGGLLGLYIICLTLEISSDTTGKDCILTQSRYMESVASTWGHVQSGEKRAETNLGQRDVMSKSRTTTAEQKTKPQRTYCVQHARFGHMLVKNKIRIITDHLEEMHNSMLRR